MRVGNACVRGILPAAVMFLAFAAAAAAADLPAGAPARPMAASPAEAATGGAPSTDVAAVRQLTSLFVFTLAIILVAIVCMVALAIVLRRRALASQRETDRKAQGLEDLWWKMQGPGAKVFDKPEEKK